MSLPFHDLLADAHHVHRQRFDPHIVEGAMLLSIKTGGCPEDCAYCPQTTANPGESRDTGLLSRLDSRIADSTLLG